MIYAFVTVDVERLYNKEEDRLFLIYYALPPGLNANKWGVSDRSLPVNIKTAINKPVIIYRKNPNNPFHTKQAGNFVHPTLEEATEELGHKPKEEEYYQWQEKFAVGRVRNVEQRKEKGYAFTLEITDPEAKNILKSDDYKTGIPGWTSPQILYYDGQDPAADTTGVHDHWIISHVILTDSPAYGFDKAALAGKCLGAEKECMIKTKSASKENLGFCVKQATIDLVESRSSQGSTIEKSYHTIMSTNETPQPTATNETVVTKTLSEQNPKQEGEQQAPPAGSGIGVEGDAKEREQTQKEEESSEPTEAAMPKTIEEAHKIIAQQSELVKTMQKEMKGFKKELDQIKTERKLFQLQTIIPRNLFKSDESYSKEIQRTMQENISESYLKDYWNTKRELAALRTEVPPMTVPKTKGASTEKDRAEDYQALNASTENTFVSSTIDRQLSLPKIMFGDSA